MNKITSLTIDMGDRVVQLGKTPGLALTASITALFTAAETTNTALKTRAAEQDAGKHLRRSGAAECERQARLVRVAMREISDIAKVLKPTELASARELFRLPGSVGDQRLLAAARAFAENAEAAKAVFIAKDMPATFVTDLTALIAAFEAAVVMRANGRTEQVSGTADVKALAKQLLGTVQELRAVLRVHWKTQPGLLEALRTAARIHRGPQAAAPTPPPAGEGGGSGTPVPPPAVS
jgi:hypothetical protein